MDLFAFLVGIVAFSHFPTSLGLKLKGSMLPCDGISIMDLMCKENEFVAAMIQNHLFEDTKSFADASLRNSPQQTCEDFLALPDRSEATLRTFLDQNFFVDGGLLAATPEDTPRYDPAAPEKFGEKLPFYMRLRDSHRRLVEALVRTWGDLGRRMVKGSVEAELDSKSTLLDLPYPFIVPGGRYRESYYWDSYWTMEGLLASGMNHTARNMLYNFMEVSRKYKLIPNGMRLYYTDRTQPPVVSEMVRIYFEKTGDVRTLVDAMPMLLTEHDRFMRGGLANWDTGDAAAAHVKNGDEPTITTDGYLVRIGFTSDPKEDLILNRYFQTNTQPRIESFDADIAVRARLAPENRDEVMREFRAASESGWDFSSRWMNMEGYGMNETKSDCSEADDEEDEADDDDPPSDRFDVAKTETMNILPVDLNSLLYRLEVNLANFVFYRPEMGEKEQLETHNFFMDLAKRRAAAMRLLMWNAKTEMWHDYNIRTKSRNEHLVHAASFFPIWAGLHQTTAEFVRGDKTPEEEELSALEALFDRGGLVHDCGMAATNLTTGQQWDFPNVWPNLVHIAVEAAVGPSSLRNWPTPTRRIIEHTERMKYLSAGGSVKPHDFHQAGPLETNSTAPAESMPSNSSALLGPAGDGFYQPAYAHYTPYFLTRPPRAHDLRRDFNPSTQRGRMAVSTARTYVDTAVALFDKHKTFASKFLAVVDAEGHCGIAGFGGEFHVAVGFGWTNGVLLNFLSNFASHV